MHSLYDSLANNCINYEECKSLNVFDKKLYFYYVKIRWSQIRITAVYFNIRKTLYISKFFITSVHQTGIG